MQSPEASRSFVAANTPALAREGIGGRYIHVFLVGGVLVIMGDHSGTVRIPPYEVERMRVGFSQVKLGKFYQIRIWRKGKARPLLLELIDGRGRAYGDIVRAFAVLVAQAGGLWRIERGENHFWAWFSPALLAGGVALILFTMEGSPWARAAGASIPGACLAFVTWLALRYAAPRRIRDMAELDRQLP